MSGSQQLLLGGAPTVTPVDPYFYSVTSLLHGDGTNGGQNNTFLDSSTNNFTITRNGNTTQGSFSPFSQTGWSNYFDGTGDYLTAPSNAAFQFGTGDFTIECWSYVTGGDNQLFYDFRSSFVSNNGFNFGRSNADGFYVYNNVEGVIIGSGAGTAATNTYVHVAVSRSGSTLRLFINGILVKTATNSTNYNSTAVPTIGGSSTTLGTPGNLYTGYISNLRVVKGTAVYTADFTVPTTPLTAISGTSLLTCQANRFLDASSNAFAITRAGDVSVQPFSPFNPITPYSTSAVGGSGYFDGSGDYLQAANNAAFDFGSGDWTVEAWVYPLSLAAACSVISKRTNTDSDYRWIVANIATNGTIYTAITTTGSSWAINANTTSAISVGQWSHIAWVRNGSDVSVYVNGVKNTLSSGFSGSLYVSTEALNIGVGGTTGSFILPMNGYMSGVRLVKGTAVYTAAFTPPTAPLTAITNTSLLLNYTNGAIFDNAAVADYETVGNAQISTSVKKYGTGSMYFDGTGDWLAAPPTSQSDLGSGDFTIECWLYRTASGATFDSGIVSRGAPSTSNGFVFAYTSSNVLTFNFNYAGAIVTGTTAIPINTWTHVAVCRIGTTFKLFVNGNVDGTATSSSSQTLNASDVFYIGRSSFDSGRIVTGYIDDLRISKGIARYPYNFTPPTAEFPNIGGTVTLTADPYFDYTTLLLPGNGTNGAQNNTFLDGSTNNFTITRNGNTTQGTFSPFSQTGWGNFFDGSGDYLTAPNNAAFDFGSGDFTIELWFYPTTVSGFQGFCGKRANSPSYGPLSPGINNGAVWLLFSTSGSSWAVNTTGGTLVANQWYHVAIVRSGTSLKAYLNGTEIISTTLSGALVSNSVAFSVGSMAADGGDPFSGYISNFRAVKGTAVYTSNFTPSTTPLTAISGTSLLTCQSNRFIDNSTNAFAITAAGNVSVQAFSPFNPTAAWSAATNGGSGYFDGSGDYLSVTNSNDFDTNTTFTLECWIYQPAAGTGTFFSRGGGNSSNFWSTSDGYQFILYISGGTLYWQWNNAGSATSISGTAPAAGAWHHVVVGYNGTTTRMWLDGASVGTSTTAYTLPTTRNRVYIGAETAVATNLMNGYIAGLRFVQGTDVYGVGNTSISVPTAPPTAVTNTKFLANFTNAGIYDATSKNDLETVGNAQISTAQSKFGGSSMYFDGTGDWLTIPRNENLLLRNADFTVECWIYVPSPSDSPIFDTRTGFSGSTAGFTLTAYSSTVIRIFTTSALISATVPNYSSTWTHVAVVRYGGTTTLYVNGVSGGTTTSLGNLTDPDWIIGGGRYGGGTPVSLNGYIDDLRITKGIARYTSNFTPPTTAFLTQ